MARRIVRWMIWRPLSAEERIVHAYATQIMVHRLLIRLPRQTQVEILSWVSRSLGISRKEL